MDLDLLMAHLVVRPWPDSGRKYDSNRKVPIHTVSARPEFELVQKMLPDAVGSRVALDLQQQHRFPRFP